MTVVVAREERIRIPDGELAAHVAIPAAGRGPGILLLHEIFGVNAGVRDCARRLAQLGYVVLAPDLYWRTQPGLELIDGPAGLEAGMVALSKLDRSQAARDAVAALDVVRAMPEVVDRRAGVVGLRLGGALSHEVAVHGEPDVAVVLHGSDASGAPRAAEQVGCPLFVHRHDAAAWEPTAAFLARELPLAAA